MNVAAWMRREVVLRAGNRCEYCRLSQAGQEAKFHIDHIEPVAAGGESTLENLALACVSCSLRKGARRKSKDPTTGRDTHLFHPRQQVWADHFVWKINKVAGVTPTGRATVTLLKMNRALAQSIRAEERFYGRHPG